MGANKKKRGADSASSSPTIIWILAAVALFACVLAGGLVGFLFRGASDGSLAPSAGRQPHATRADLKQDPLWPLIKEVADQFLCGCGKCGELELTECVCPAANGGIAEKNYIRKQLVAGHSVTDVAADVESKYGYRKPASPAAVFNPATVSPTFDDKGSMSE